MDAVRNVVNCFTSSAKEQLLFESLRPKLKKQYTTSIKTIFVKMLNASLLCSFCEIF